MRRWRESHSLEGLPKLKHNARSYARVYLKRGELKKEPCCVCGDANSQIHHPDHEQPLLVVWICRSCHLDWHSFWRLISLEVFTNWMNEQRAEIERRPARKNVA